MEEINELILFENENTRLDFKKIEYRKENYTSFLKDVISMSNANTQEDRYILIGLKPKSEKDRGLEGITGELTDSANLQQLVYENIEPELQIDYFPHLYKEYKIGVIRIYNCNNQPYLMKKDYGNGKNKLCRGEGFIRKGSHQTRLTRKDYDRFTSKKNDDRYFKGEVIFSFETENPKNEIVLVSIDDIKLPSQIKREKIERIIKKKTEKAETMEKFGMSHLNFLEGINFHPLAYGGTTSYEQRSVETLKDNLKNVEKTYSDHDYYELLENNSNKCNISLYNKSFNYIEDASIIIKIPKLEGIYVAEKIYSNPNNNSMISGKTIHSMNYPLVNTTNNYFVIENTIGNIKHQKKQDAFDLDFRLFTSTKLKIKELKIVCELYAKNLKTYIEKELIIKIKK